VCHIVRLYTNERLRTYDYLNYCRIFICFNFVRSLTFHLLVRAMAHSVDVIIGGVSYTHGA
jgi:hypothetical protein